MRVTMTMRRQLGLLILITSAASLAWGQGASISGQVIQPAPPVGTGGPAPFATIQICPYIGGSGLPCSPLANLFSDPGLTQSISNPATADANGNYSIFVADAYYIVQITPVSGTTYSYLVLAEGGTVTSVALTMPSIFTVTGSPIVNTGTFAVTFNSQSPNLVLASPNGSSGLPSFRNIVGGDFGTQTTNEVLGTCGTTTPAFCVLTAGMIPSTLNATSFSGNVGVTGNLSAVNLSASGTLSVTGNATLGGTLGITGTATAPIFNATTGYQVAGAAVLNHFLLGNGAEYVDASTLPASAVSGLFYQTIAANGIDETQQPKLNLISGGGLTVGCVDTHGLSRTDCTFSTVGSTAATVTLGTGAGSGATFTCPQTCTDAGGSVAITAGTAAALNSVFTVTFGASHTHAWCSFSVNDSSQSASSPGLWAEVSPTTFELFNTLSALTSSVDYEWTYVCNFN